MRSGTIATTHPESWLEYRYVHMDNTGTGYGYKSVGTLIGTLSYLCMNSQYFRVCFCGMGIRTVLVTPPHVFHGNDRGPENAQKLTELPRASVNDFELPNPWSVAPLNTILK
jgi:hypothetical protein